MLRRLLPALLAIAVLPAAPAAAQDCPATGQVDAKVPTWEAVHGYALGSRQATYAEVIEYMQRVDAASERVELGVLARSFQGRDLPYAIVTEPGRDVGAVARTLRGLREGRPKPAEIDRATAETPAIVWVTAGVHGNEPSATDAHMRVLYELAARGDCENLRRVRELVTVLLPMQNPDGRENGARTNAYNFDLNRDWFARTQPETEGKLRMLRRYPPLFYIDGHEQVGTAGFFPPNADPIHHEIAAAPLRHINEVYSPAMRAAMDARGSDYTNYTTYDLFFMGYGDTVPDTLFNAAGMTFEKGGQAPYPEKEADHFTLADTTLDVAAARKDELLGEWGRAWYEARQQGAARRLEPNLVVQPENTVRFPVPDISVWGYAWRGDRHAADAAALAERLRSMGVEVDRLRRAATVRGFKAYGRAPGTQTLPRGTYLARLGQPNKHWVQALLGEDTYVPFPYFYDVSGWSNPLLMGLDGGALTEAIPRRTLRPRRRRPLLERVEERRAQPLEAAAAYLIAGDSAGALRAAFELVGEGVEVRRSRGDGRLIVDGDVDRGLLRWVALRHGTPVFAQREAPAGTVRLQRPRVALLVDPSAPPLPIDTPGNPAGTAAALSQSGGFTRFVLEQRLGEPVAQLTAAELTGDRLSAGGFTHLVVPDGLLPQGGIDPVGLQRVQDFVRAGGTFVGVRGQGLDVARSAGISTVTTRSAPEGFQVPGAAFRVELDPASPLAWGERSEGFAFNVGDPIFEPGSASGRDVVRYPAGDGFFVSGYTEGAEALKGTIAATDEAFGAGRVLLFAFDPNFRAYVEASERLFANALLYPRGAGVAAARRPVRPELLGAHRPARDTVVRVRPADAQALRAAAAGVPAGSTWRIAAGGALELRAPNGAAFPGHPPGWAQQLVERLAEAGVRPELLVL